MQSLQADNEDSDQTARMRRLVCLCWVYMSEVTFSHVAAQINVQNLG